MKTLLVAGGDPNHWPAISNDFDKIIGIDRGNLYLLRRGIIPDLAIGDFDSLNDAEKRKCLAKLLKCKPHLLKRMIQIHNWR